METSQEEEEELTLPTQSEKDEALQAHNDCRCKVNPPAEYMPVMTTSDAIIASAQISANRCVWAHGSYSERNMWGENMYYSSDPRATYRQAVEGWDSEVRDYDYDTNRPKTPGKAVGHYTQVVWADSTKVGCAKKYCPSIQGRSSGGVIIVCQYDPLGNMRNKKPYDKDDSGDGFNLACGNGGLISASGPSGPIPASGLIPASGQCDNVPNPSVTQCKRYKDPRGYWGADDLCVYSPKAGKCLPMGWCKKGKLDCSGASVPCSRPSQWCSHSGSVYKNVDCDGDGILDHACVDRSNQRGYIASKSGCVSVWPNAPKSSCPAAFN